MSRVVFTKFNTTNNAKNYILWIQTNGKNAFLKNLGNTSTSIYLLSILVRNFVYNKWETNFYFYEILRLPEY